MTKHSKQYLRCVRSFMPIRSRTEHRFVNNLRDDLEEFDRIHPDSSYETLTHEFGSPWDMFYSYLSEQNSGLLIRRVKARKIVLRIFVGILLAIALGLVLYTSHLIKEYDRTMDTAVNGYTNTIEIIE